MFRHFEIYVVCFPLQDIVIETILGAENSVQDLLFLKLLFVSSKIMSQSIH